LLLSGNNHLTETHLALNAAPEYRVAVFNWHLSGIEIQRALMETSTTLSPFHSGEREVQTRVGVREFSEHLGQRMIRDYLPGDHKAFFSQLPFVLIGASDAQGRP
jgi:hypothetical protein